MIRSFDETAQWTWTFRSVPFHGAQTPADPRLHLSFPYPAMQRGWFGADAAQFRRMRVDRANSTAPFWLTTVRSSTTGPRSYQTSHSPV